MKRSVIAGMLAVALVFISACAAQPAQNEEPLPSAPVQEPPVEALPTPPVQNESKGDLANITIQDAKNAACAFLDKGNPDVPGIGGDALYLKADADGTQMLSFIRLPLPTGIRAAQVQEAYLQVCYKEGDALVAHAGKVTQPWVMSDITWNTGHEAVSFENVAEGEALEDGWVQFDVTAIVQSWLHGDSANYGFVLEPVEACDTKFYAMEEAAAEKFPRLVVEYYPEEAETSFGKYTFSEQQEGNCLSYAFRDTDPVYIDAIVPETAEFEEAIAEGYGVPYFANAVWEYLQAYQKEMGISHIRVIEEGEEIDPATEYRVALRMGFHERNGEEGIQVEGDEFDYHLRMQLADGSWAEKFPQDTSRVVPGTNAENSLNQLPWDSSYMMGYWKWSEFYDSEIIYYAVTKSTDEFTAHAGGKDA